MKMTQLVKEEASVSLFADDMILHIGELKGSAKRLLRIIREYGKSGTGTKKREFNGTE